MPNCPNCGNLAPEGVAYCDKCGAPLAANIPPYMGASPYAQPEKKRTSPWVWIAIACIALACMCTVPAAILFPVFSQAKRSAQATVELSNMKQVALGVIIFTSDHDDKFPDFQGGKLGAQLAEYLKMPELRAKADTYVWNSALEGHRTTDVQNAATVWMAHGSAPDARGRYIFAFVDGHAQAVTADAYETMLARPIVFAKAP